LGAIVRAADERKLALTLPEFMLSTAPLPREPRPVAGGPGPPYDNDMDRRLTILETRFDTILPTLATKHDLDLLRGELRGEMDKLRAELLVELHKAIHVQTKWMIGLFLSMLLAMLGLNFAMLNAIKSIPVAQQRIPASAPGVPAQTQRVPQPLFPLSQ
jgi:hypothetical protein